MTPALLTAQPQSLNTDGRTEAASAVDRDGIQSGPAQDVPDDETTLFSIAPGVIRFEDVLSHNEAPQKNAVGTHVASADIGSIREAGIGSIRVAGNGSIRESVDVQAVFGQRDFETGPNGQFESGGDPGGFNAAQNAVDVVQPPVNPSRVSSTAQEPSAAAASTAESPLNPDGKTPQTEQQQDPSPSTSEQQAGDANLEVELPKPTLKSDATSAQKPVNAETGSTATDSETQPAALVKEAITDIVSNSATHGAQAAPEGPTAKQIDAAARLAKETAPVEQIRRVLVGHKAEFVREEPMRLEVRLDPPELGRIWIRVERTETGLSAQLSVQDESVRLALESRVDDLQRDLGESGLSFAGFELADHGRRFADTSTSGPNLISDSPLEVTTETSTHDLDTSDGTINLLV